MPELPEVETVRRGLLSALEGRRLVRVIQRRPDLRFPLPENFPARLEGQTIDRLERRAKYLLAHTRSGEVLLCHLGMSGRMTLVADPELPFAAHDHVILETDAGVQLRFNDARRFGIMDLVPAEALETHRLLAGLGPEPLGNAFNGPALAVALKGRRTPIKAALLDQRVVAGLGNIYVSEALYEARISPRRQAYSVQGQRAERLAQAVRSVLLRAIDAGGSSLRDYVQTSGELGYFQHQWAVYDKEGQPCGICGATGQASAIRRIVQSGRSTFYCPRHQR